jgi:hypothetical protein
MLLITLHYWLGAEGEDQRADEAAAVARARLRQGEDHP